jgi:hypothetical protein
MANRYLVSDPAKVIWRTVIVNLVTGKISANGDVLDGLGGIVAGSAVSESIQFFEIGRVIDLIKLNIAPGDLFATSLERNTHGHLTINYHINPGGE